MKTSDNVASIKDNYGRFFSLYNDADYVSALKTMRTFIEGISKYGITEISRQCYKRDGLLSNKELFLVYNNNYYIVAAMDISRQRKSITVKRINKECIIENEQINNILYIVDEYGTVKVKRGICYKFESSGLPLILYNLIELQTKHLKKPQQKQILTKIEGLSDKYKLCNPYAHTGDYSSAETDAKSVYGSIKGDIDGIISALEAYCPILENTIQLLKSLSSDSQKEFKSDSKKDIANSPKQREEVRRNVAKNNQPKITKSDTTFFVGDIWDKGSQSGKKYKTESIANSESNCSEKEVKLNKTATSLFEEPTHLKPSGRISPTATAAFGNNRVVTPKPTQSNGSKQNKMTRAEEIRIERIRIKEKVPELRNVFFGSILNVIISIGMIIGYNECDTDPMYFKYIIVAIATICGAFLPYMIAMMFFDSEDSTFFTKPFVRQAEKAIKIRVQDSFKWTIIEFCPVIIAIAIASVTLLSSINSIILSSLIINFGVIVTAHINSFKSYTDSPQAPSMYPTSAHWGMILLNSVIAFSIPTIIYLFLVA